MKKNLIFLMMLMLLVFFAYAGIDVIISVFPANESYINMDNPDFIFNVIGSETSYSCELFVEDSKGWFSYGTNKNVLNNTMSHISPNSSIEDGEISWYVNCTKSEYSLLSDTYYFILDKTPPVVSSLNYPPNFFITTNKNIQFNFTSYDNIDTILAYKLFLNHYPSETGLTSGNNTATTFTLFDIADGHYNWTIEVADDAGNNINFSSYHYFTIDTIPPVTTDNEVGGWHSEDYIITLTATDAVSQVRYTSYQINEGEWINGTVILISEEGNHTIKYYSVDNAGNKEDEKTIFAALDKTLPIVSSLNYPADGSVVDSSLYAEFSFTSYDNIDTILAFKLFLNGKENVTGLTSGNNTPTTFSLNLEKGITYTWTIEVADDAGNVGNYSVPYTLIVPAYPPDTAPILEEGNVTDSNSDGNIEIVWTADPYATYYRIYRDSQNFTDATSLIALATVEGTSFIDNTSLSGMTYWYAITTVDERFNENKSNPSASFYATAIDTIMPQQISELEVVAKTDGSIYLNWTPVLFDIEGNPDIAITYKIFRTTNITSLNTNLSDENIAVTTDPYYKDIDIVIGTNYTYVITTLDDGDNYNANVGENNIKSAIPVECTNDFTYTSWTACSGGSQSRIGTRECYSGGNTIIEESRSCRTSSGGGSSRSPTSQKIENTSKITQSIIFSQINPGDIVAFIPNLQNIVFERISFESASQIPFISITASAFENKPDDLDSLKNVYKYLELSSKELNLSHTKKGIEVSFKVPKTWVNENSKDRNSVFLYRFSEGRWARLQTSYIKSSEEYYHYTAFTSGFSYFAIAADEKPVNPETAPKVDNLLDTEFDSEEAREVIVVPSEESEPSEENIPIYVWFLLIIFIIIVIISIFFLSKEEKEKKDISIEKIKKKLKKK